MSQNQQRREQARLLLGRLVRFNHQADYQAHRVRSISLDGMVEVEGLSGLFAPSLFVVVPEPLPPSPAAPEEA